MPGIDAYRDIANSRAPDTNILQKESERIVSRRPGQLSSSSDGITRSVTSPSSSRSTIVDFKNALERKFGSVIKKQISDQYLDQKQDNLTVGKVRNVLNVADNLQVLYDFRRALIYQYGGAVTDRALENIDDRVKEGQIKISPMQRISAMTEALSQFKQTKIEARDESLEIERQKRAAIETLPGDVRSIVSEAVSSLHPPCAKRLQVYRPYLERALAQVAPIILRAAAQGEEQNLLNSVAKQITKRLDEYVLEAVYQRALDEGRIGDERGSILNGSYEDFIDSMGDDGEEKLINLASFYPSIIRNLDLQSRQLADSIEEMASRVLRDLDEVKDTFFSHLERPESAPSGIKDIKITTSDPHHDGRRVMILSFDGQGDSKVVYKPRDIRIDAKLVGDSNREDLGQSIGSYVDELLREREEREDPQSEHLSMPTYRFLPKQDSVDGESVTGRYGYVEYLSSLSDADNQLNPVEAKNFYRNIGRQTAMFMLFGITDLHQTNMFASKKQPYFTDLEIGFYRPILENLQKSESGPGPINPSKAVNSTMINKALFCRNESVRRPRVKVSGEQLKVQEAKEDNTDIEAIVKIEVTVDENTVYRLSQKKETRSPYSNDIKVGFREVLETIGNKVVEEPRHFDPLLESFRGLHARYHPISTGDQLAVLDDMKKSGLTLSAEAEEIKMARYAESKIKEIREVRDYADLHEIKNSLKKSVVKAWKNLDVVYYTHSLGYRELLFNGTEVIQTGVGESGTDYFTLDALETVKQIIRNLAEPEYRQTLISGGATRLGSYMQ